MSEISGGTGEHARRHGLASFVGSADGGAVAFVAAHPDDAIIGAGGQLPDFRRAIFVYVTDGAPADMRDARAHGFDTREAYAAARRVERDACLAVAGIAARAAIDLPHQDQRASFEIPAIARELADLLCARGVRAVVTHPYEGGHPDHDATAMAVHAACALATRSGLAPELFEFTSYHSRGGQMIAGEFIGDTGCAAIDVALSPEQAALKRRMFECHRTQAEVLRAFRIGSERFRRAPRYNFAGLPNGGDLLYEHFGWGMYAARWRALSSAALRELGLDGVL